MIIDSNFRKYWLPEEHITIDEGLICFKGKFLNRVHIQEKPNATGLKIYTIADGSKYLWSFWLYDGEKLAIDDVVLDFVHKLPNKHSKVYLDSWYGSEKLAISLHNEGYLFVMACGKNKTADIFNNYLDLGLTSGQVR